MHGDCSENFLHLNLRFTILVIFRVLLYNFHMAKLDAFSLKKMLGGTEYDGRSLTVCVALSGGRDSVALLHCLKTLETENAVFQKAERGEEGMRIKVVAANVEHGIRGESSLRDSEFVNRLCKDMGVELYTFSVDVPTFARENGYTVEQAARILRYRCFDELLRDGKCDSVALAHHLDDQIETVLMRILRGTGIRGLSGMKRISGGYIRPFLDYSREDIDEYVAEHNLKYVEDESNADTAYTRNYLRNVVKGLKDRFPDIGNSIKRLCANAEEADKFIDAFVPEIEVNNGVSYVKTADCANTTIAKRLILRAAAALGVEQDIEVKHLNAVLLLSGAESGKNLNLTHGLKVYREGDRLVFTRERVNESGADDGNFESPFDVGNIPNLRNLGLSVKEVGVDCALSGIGRGEALYADADKIPKSAVIRSVRAGDFIHKFGGGTKSLGDYLTDKKIPARVRGGLIVVADGSRVLAVFGVDISSDLKIDGNTKRVYELRLTQNNVD